jgi:hypothetical protein
VSPGRGKLTITGDSCEGRRQHFWNLCFARLESGGHKAKDDPRRKPGTTAAHDGPLRQRGGRGHEVPQGRADRAGMALPREAEGRIKGGGRHAVRVGNNCSRGKRGPAADWEADVADGLQRRVGGGTARRCEGHRSWRAAWRERSHVRPRGKVPLQWIAGQMALADSGGMLSRGPRRTIDLGVTYRPAGATCGNDVQDDTPSAAARCRVCCYFLEARRHAEPAGVAHHDPLAGK